MSADFRSRVEGERPYSTVKIAIAVAIGLIIVGIIAFLQIEQGYR